MTSFSLFKSHMISSKRMHPRYPLTCLCLFIIFFVSFSVCFSLSLSLFLSLSLSIFWVFWALYKRGCFLQNKQSKPPSLSPSLLYPYLLPHFGFRHFYLSTKFGLTKIGSKRGCGRTPSLDPPLL